MNNQAALPDPDVIKREDLYQQAIDLYCVEYGETMAIRHNARAVRAVVDLALDSQPAPQPWDVLREAAKAFRAAPDDGWHAHGDDCTELADELEANHRAAQERAAADAAREKLIEKAARALAGPVWETLGEHTRDAFRESARGLADAGMLVDPDVEVTA